MGFMDELKRLTRPYDEDEDEPFLNEDEPAREPEPAPREKPKANPFSNFSAESASLSQSSSSGRGSRPKEGRVVSIGGQGSSGQTQVVILKPERFESAAEIADHLRNRRAVLVNLEAAPKEITRRLVDFLSGVTYAINGDIRKVSSNTYILTPPSIDLVGDQLDGLEATGVYF